MAPQATVTQRLRPLILVGRQSPRQTVHKERDPRVVVGHDVGNRTQTHQSRVPAKRSAQSSRCSSVILAKRTSGTVKS
ncbi:hypothetical protein SAMN05444004_10257 [Jannaschia faecimaris]|uniref:Uncharacterized protein n=1 Tax=Jannaschia faecimaris TaxID=1244108 RepID=A0A1H3L2Z5_9RHOB|nr:hypothetical protein SAMN05444004_10257 [Jannaschia faecimaris]